MKKTLLHAGFYKVWGIKRDGHTREVIEGRNSAALLIYIVDMNALVFLEQYREAVRSKENPKGLLLEVPAGIFDGKFTPQELMAKEALEEVGVTVLPHEIELLNGGAPLFKSPGGLTEQKYLGYVEVSSSRVDTSKTMFGLAKEGERIKRRIISVDETASIRFNDLAAWALMQWFARTKWKGADA